MKTESAPRQPLDLEKIRARLASGDGRTFWRSLDQLAETEKFREFLHQEFPRQTGLLGPSVNRRRFLQLMAASLALAGLNACSGQPEEEIVPYVRSPEEIVPGKPLFFATAMVRGGIARGVLVESHMGRPTKVEGNPNHPDSLGATDAIAQASILTLYDPDRAQIVNHLGRIGTWRAFLSEIRSAMETHRRKRGAGFRLLTESVTSPTLAHQIEGLLSALPEAKWHQYDPAAALHAQAGSALAFGQPMNTHYRFDRADVILSLDSDFLFLGPGSLRYARDFIARRRVRAERQEMNRLYVAESTPTVTGTMADHRINLAAQEIGNFAQAVAQELGVLPKGSAEPLLSTRLSQWAAAVARDLRRSRGASVVLTGEAQPPSIHALVHAINHALGNVGKTVVHTDPVEARPVNLIESLSGLASDMEDGRVETLVIIGGNPAYDAPADLNFAELLNKVRLRVHLSLYENETSALSHWHLPETHFLESWGDARAYDGTVTILQPLISPLYRGKTAHELMAICSGRPGMSAYDIVRDYWRERNASGDFERFWRTALHDGIVAGTAFSSRPTSLQLQNLRQVILKERRPPRTSNPRALDVIFRTDPTIWDGQYANNGWLQELPKPLTKLTWDNAALFSPVTADRLGLTNEDVVELRLQQRTVRAPVWILPGQPDESVTVHLGYGRRRGGKIGIGIGFNAYAIRTADAFWVGHGLEVRKTGERYPLATTQHHYSMEGRHLVREGTLEEYKRNPDFVREMGHDPRPGETLYPPWQYKGHAWGMTIDLNACTGCNACVTACQAENNIPIVGKEEVTRGREMHWIRIDRYYKGNLSNPETYHQPVLCMHCENAPCEVVCPVQATVHSKEGLNEMIYNRCVGTRYCSNNCPYKVRRFNFFQYAKPETEVLKMLMNPDVTVRSRGVMEKCTYCVQRINAARIEAEKKNRPIRDGEIITACQAACPTEAIVFGDVNDPDSRVSKLKAEPLEYGLLTDLNTRPRTTYLAQLKNPNPEMESA